MYYWQPPVSYNDIDHLLANLGETIFIEETMTKLKETVSFAARSMNGQTIHPHVFISRKGQQLELTCYIPDEVRCKSGSGALWTKPLVLFRSELEDFKDPAGDWKFERVLTRETFNAWQKEATRVLETENVPTV